MAPSWLFAILFVLSAFLGTGLASSIKFCGDDNKSQCVDREFCNSQRIQFRTFSCRHSQVCCRVEEMNVLAAGESDEYA